MCRQRVMIISFDEKCEKYNLLTTLDKTLKKCVLVLLRGMAAE